VAVKAGYKQTEVGIIPADWNVLPFREQFNISAGGDVNLELSSSEQDEIHRFPIYSNALTDQGLYGYCSYADHPAHSITITARGTLGVATYRDHRYTAIGRVLVLEPRHQTAGRFFAEFINDRVKFAIESTGVAANGTPDKWLSPRGSALPRTTCHCYGVERRGCALGGAGSGHRQEARPQAGRHAATSHWADPSARVSGGVVGAATRRDRAMAGRWNSIDVNTGILDERDDPMGIVRRHKDQPAFNNTK
jgi:hypothetical protein